MEAKALETGFRIIQAEPVTPAIGAEISGVDLTAPVSEDEFEEIHRALMEYQVLFFRDQPIDLESQKAFARRFGELHTHPAAPPYQGDPEVMEIRGDGNSKIVAGNRWHTDVSCDPEPPMGTMLHIHSVPPSGGDTLFASMYAAYEALSEPMKRFLSGLTALHGSEHVYRGRYPWPGVDDEDKQFPQAEHPVVRTHPVTGRKGLYVNPTFTLKILGLTAPESRAVLKFLYDHMKSPEFQCRFKWKEHSIAFWDNRCAQHYALWDYYPNVRHGLRVTIKGDRPY